MAYVLAVKCTYMRLKSMSDSEAIFQPASGFVCLDLVVNKSMEINLTTNFRS